MRITVPVESAPLLRRVDLVKPDDKKYGDSWLISERGRKDTLINLELLRSWGAANEAVLIEYNKTIERRK